MALLFADDEPVAGAHVGAAVFYLKFAWKAGFGMKGVPALRMPETRHGLAGILNLGRTSAFYPDESCAVLAFFEHEPATVEPDADVLSAAPERLGKGVDAALAPPKN